MASKNMVFFAGTITTHQKHKSTGTREATNLATNIDKILVVVRTRNIHALRER